jgi:tetrahydromethanopterin S-methyltransferase subunit E
LFLSASALWVGIGKSDKWKSAWVGNFDMQLTPLIAVHMTAAIGAVVIGPFALWARMGSRPFMY